MCIFLPSGLRFYYLRDFLPDDGNAPKMRTSDVSGKISGVRSDRATALLMKRPSFQYSDLLRSVCVSPFINVDSRVEMKSVKNE